MDYLKKDQDRRQAVIMNHAYHNGEYNYATWVHWAFWITVTAVIVATIII